ncbi:MAG: DUF1722 domain-containing protein [Promethearchaeota archaeon]|nr:MAG: DUF1722 domain-containing protein [Candidatus Lokiarchaeota archaeon]
MRDKAEFAKPKVVVSKCIEFDYCRWNGNTIRSPVVEVLKTYVDFHPVCAEVEIGLGIPRDPVRIIIENDQKTLIQPSTGRNLTDIMKNFSDRFLNSLDFVDGFILKSQSPSCGLFQTKYLAGAQKGAAKLGVGPGFFGEAVLNKFPNLPIETEGRLKNFLIREFFLSKLYTLASFREIKFSSKIQNLVEFHTKNKFLFMAFNQVELKNLGRIVANQEKNEFSILIDDYEKTLLVLLQKPNTFTSNINVMMHALGYFKKYLTHEEKAFFLDSLEKYRSGWIPMFVITNLLKSWIVRFNQEYLAKQTFFESYPEELMTFDLKETWRGRDYWSKK